jgi:hypothetical protein
MGNVRVYKISLEESQAKMLPGRPGYRWYVNININLGEIG